MALTPEYVTQIEDWLKWFNQHWNTLPGKPVERQIEFYHKAIRGIFVILAGLTYEVERVDLGRRSERRLILPVSFRQ